MFAPALRFTDRRLVFWPEFDHKQAFVKFFFLDQIEESSDKKQET